MLRVYSFEIPFKVPFRFSGSTIEKRKGIIFSMKTENGIFWSEASPLPGFSTESFEDVRFEAIQIEKWLPILQADVPPAFTGNETDALKFALSSLWYSARAASEGKSLSKYLNPASLERIPINAAIGIGDESEVFRYAKAAIQSGFGTLKLKVGRDFNHEYTLLKKLREYYPSVAIRIDANQSWEPEEALENLKMLEPLEIQYCEQPLKVGENDNLAWLKKNTTQFIAADESVRCYEDALKLIHEDVVDILVLKPTLIGTIEAYKSIVKVAEDAGIEVVTTTTLESGIGRRLVAHLCSTVQPVKYANGLATGGLFEYDLLPDNHLIKNGQYFIYEIENNPSVNTEHLLLIAES